MRRLTEEDLARAGYVFINAMIVQRDSAGEIIQRCKAASLGVVAGGRLFTMEYDQFLEVDLFFLLTITLSATKNISGLRSCPP